MKEKEKLTLGLFPTKKNRSNGVLPTGSFKEKLIKFDGIGQKKPHLLRKAEFHLPTFTIKINQSVGVHTYIYIPYMEYLSMFFDFDCK